MHPQTNVQLQIMHAIINCINKYDIKINLDCYRQQYLKLNLQLVWRKLQDIQCRLYLDLSFTWSSFIFVIRRCSGEKNWCPASLWVSFQLKVSTAHEPASLTDRMSVNDSGLLLHISGNLRYICQHLAQNDLPDQFHRHPVWHVKSCELGMLKATYEHAGAEWLLWQQPEEPDDGPPAVVGVSLE